MLNLVHWWVAIAMSGCTLPVRYISIPTALQYSQSYFLGTPWRSLFKWGFLTWVSYSFVLPFPIPRKAVIILIKKGCASSNVLASICLMFTIRYLSIDPLSCNTKCSSPLWSNRIRASIHCIKSPKMMQLSTYVSTMHPWPKKTQGATLLGTKPQSSRPLLSFANQL